MHFRASHLSGSEYFQSSRPGLEDMTSGRCDPNEAYTALSEAVISLYAQTAKEIGVPFSTPMPTGDMDSRRATLRQIVKSSGVPLTETRAERLMREVYDALKGKVLPKLAKAWDAQDVVASNAVLRRLYKERDGLLQGQKVNEEFLQIYGGLVGFIAKRAPPPFSTALKKYETWFADYSRKSFEDQIAAVNAEIPKVEAQHRKVIAARTVRVEAREEAQKKKAEAESRAPWLAAAGGGVLGLLALLLL